MSADPAGWTEKQLRGLRALLVGGGAADIADAVDYAEVRRALPAMRSAIDACLVHHPAMVQSSAYHGGGEQGR